MYRLYLYISNLLLDFLFFLIFLLPKWKKRVKGNILLVSSFILIWTEAKQSCNEINFRDRNNYRNKCCITYVISEQCICFKLFGCFCMLLSNSGVIATWNHFLSNPPFSNLHNNMCISDQGNPFLPDIFPKQNQTKIHKPLQINCKTYTFNHCITFYTTYVNIKHILYFMSTGQYYVSCGTCIHVLHYSTFMYYYCKLGSCNQHAVRRSWKIRSNVVQQSSFQ